MPANGACKIRFPYLGLVVCGNCSWLNYRLFPVPPIERQILANAIARMSLVSWQRTNLHGEVDLPDEALLDYLRFDLDALFAFH
jgi:hypothetical protein